MNKRLVSIDVFRGMTIFFMIIVNTLGSWKYAYPFLLHAKWDGLTPTDLVFPFFMFIVGMAMAFSFRKYQRGSRGEWIRKILKRTVLIFLIGLLLNWFPFFNKSLDQLRIFGVLQRIALGYGLAALLVVFVKKAHLIYVTAIILIGYWLLLIFGGGESPLSLEGNLVRRIDLLLLGENHVYGGYGIPFDPEGLLSTIPSVATVLLGYLLGQILLLEIIPSEKLKKLGVWGLILMVLGVVWNFIGFPINKPIWSSSYVLVTAGLAALIMVGLIYLIDIRKSEKWSYMFKVFGLNPLFSYVMSGLIVRSLNLIKIEDTSLYPWIYKTIFSPVFGAQLGSAMQALLYTILIWMIALMLYRRKIIIKI